MTAATARHTRQYATDRQCQTLVSLHAEYNPLLAADLDARGPADGTPRDETFERVIAEIRTATTQPGDFARYTRSAASDMIGTLITSIRKLKAQARERNATTPTAPAITPGLYSADGDVYRVKLARTGNLYAQRLEITTHDDETTTEWVYEGARPLRTLTLTPLSKDAASAYGRQTGVCCVCGALLTNPVSVEAGIGPICGGRL